MNTETTSEILVQWYKLTFLDRKPGYVHTNTDTFETAHIFTRILHDKKQETEYNHAIISGGSRGRVWNPPPIKPDACLRLKCFHQQDRISPFNWLIFLMKRASHFATRPLKIKFQGYSKM